jgi:hypothetical protein
MSSGSYAVREIPRRHMRRKLQPSGGSARHDAAGPSSPSPNVG